MKITIEANPKEIAALVVAVQERQKSDETETSCECSGGSMTHTQWEEMTSSKG